MKLDQRKTNWRRASWRGVRAKNENQIFRLNQQVTLRLLIKSTRDVHEILFRICWINNLVLQKVFFVNKIFCSSELFQRSISVENVKNSFKGLKLFQFICESGIKLPN